VWQLTDAFRADSAALTRRSTGPNTFTGTVTSTGCRLRH